MAKTWRQTTDFLADSLPFSDLNGSAATMHQLCSAKRGTACRRSLLARTPRSRAHIMERFTRWRHVYLPPLVITLVCARRSLPVTRHPSPPPPQPETPLIHQTWRARSAAIPQRSPCMPPQLRRRRESLSKKENTERKKMQRKLSQGERRDVEGSAAAWERVCGRGTSFSQ